MATLSHILKGDSLMPKQEMLPLASEFRETHPHLSSGLPRLCEAQSMDLGAAGGEGRRKAMPGRQVSPGPSGGHDRESTLQPWFQPCLP